METIGKQNLWSILNGAQEAEVTNCTSVRKAVAHRVRSFLELATKVAELQYRNREYVLLFRGQPNDHRNLKGNTTLEPSIFRGEGTRNPNADTLQDRFAMLDRAEKELASLYAEEQILGHESVRRNQIIRWSILQHYMVCPTPLLDVTQSLRIAASFASDKADGRAHIFVLGVPNLSGAITASAEAEVQVIRLASVCPPFALRPHIQEGYLLGEYPQMIGYGQKEIYHHYEIDFGRRLVAKFVFDPRTFWKDNNFPLVSRQALYPSSAADPFRKLALEVKQSVNPN